MTLDPEQTQGHLRDTLYTSYVISMVMRLLYSIKNTYVLITYFSNK